MLEPLAVIVAVCPTQIVEEVTDTIGKGVTDTFAIAVLVQPNAAPITVYVVFIVGASVNVLNKEPLFQEYVVAPLTVIVAVCPEHIVDEFTTTVGNGVTETSAIAVFVQPKDVPITV